MAQVAQPCQSERFGRADGGWTLGLGDRASERFDVPRLFGLERRDLTCPLLDLAG